MSLFRPFMVLRVLAGIALLGLGACAGLPSDPGTPYFSDWPVGTSPQEVGKRVAENFLPRKFRYETGTYASAPRSAGNSPVVYPEVIAWYGALTFADVTKDTVLEQALIHKFDRFLTPAGEAHVGLTKSVDLHVFGAVPLEIYLLNKDKTYLDYGQQIADEQLADVFRPNGYGPEARFWADDLYMMPLLQVQATRATKDLKYVSQTAKMFADYLVKLQQSDGLFFHGQVAHYYWCRGNGWACAGMAELLQELPPSDPNYDKVMNGYKLMMATLLKDQGDDGLWKELINHQEAYSETSGSGMFTFAMVTGVKKGWLDAATYGPAARKAWLGLIKYLNADANMTNICVSTNEWMPPRAGGPGGRRGAPAAGAGAPATPAQPAVAPVTSDLDETAATEQPAAMAPGQPPAPTGRGAPHATVMNPDPVQYYLTRPVISGDALNTFDVLHGNAPVLWTATELLR